MRLITHRDLEFLYLSGDKYRELYLYFYTFSDIKNIPRLLKLFSLWGKEAAGQVGDTVGTGSGWTLNSNLGATAADVQTISKVNSQSKSGATGNENPFCLN